MDAFRQWAFSLCAAAAVCALIELLLPELPLSRMVRLALSVFFLCVMIQPIGLGSLTGEFSASADQGMAEAEQYSQQMLDRIEGDLNRSAAQAAAEVLEQGGFSPEKYGITVRAEGDRFRVEVVLPADSPDDPEQIRELLEEDPMFRAEVRREEL